MGGKGLFKVRTCSAALTAITGKSKMTCPAIVKAVWGYIKSKKLNNKRMINPDGAGQGHWRQDVDVQDEQGALQAREVSAHLCVKSRSLTRAGPLFGDLLQAPGPWGSSASQARHSCSLLSAGYSI